MELMGLLVVKVATVDGEFHPAKRRAITEVLGDEWGYDAHYVERTISALESANLDEAVGDVAVRLAEFQNRNPDCNPEPMQCDLIEFVREVVMPDGVLRSEEERALTAIDDAFRRARSEPELLTRSGQPT